MITDPASSLARTLGWSRDRFKSLHLLVMAALMLGLVVGLSSIPTASSSVVAQGGVAQVMPTHETPTLPGAGTPGGDIAIWLHPTDPSLSTVIGTDKSTGLGVYDLDGVEIQFLNGYKMKNVDVRYNFPLGGGFVDLIVAGNRDNDTLATFMVDPVTRLLQDVTDGNLFVNVIRADGICMYTSPITENHYVFVSDNGGRFEQWHLFDNGAGLVTGNIVRAFDVGLVAEGCVADDEHGDLYIAEESVGGAET